MRTRLVIVSGVIVASVILLAAHASSRVRLTKVEERDSVATFVLQNDTRGPVVTEFVGIVESSGRGLISNGLTRTSFIEPGSNRIIKASGDFSPTRRFMVAYRHRPSAFEERLRRWGASARVCSEYPPAKELLCIYYP